MSQTQEKRLKETEIRERKREMKEKARDGNSDREGSKRRSMGGDGDGGTKRHT